MEKVKYHILSDIQHVKDLEITILYLELWLINRVGVIMSCTRAPCQRYFLIETVLGTCLVLEKQSLFFIVIYGDNFVQKLSKHGP